MSLIKDFINYLSPKRKFKPVPRQLIRDYKITDATEQEMLIMLFNHARSPEVAQNLLERYGVETAYDLIQELPEKHYHVTWKTRLKRLLWKYAGHQEGDPYRCDMIKSDRLDY